MKRIVSLAMVLALIMVAAMPAAVNAGDVAVTGNQDASFVFTAPGAVSLNSGDHFVIGENKGSGTAGSIVCNTSTWTLSVTDAKSTNSGYMTKNGTSDVTKLASPATFSISEENYGTIAQYQTALQGQSNYGNPVASFSVPLYVSQTVAASDVAGDYTITLTYTTTPGT